MSGLVRNFGRGDQQSPSDWFTQIASNAIVYNYPNGDWDVICAAEKVFMGEGFEAAARHLAAPDRAGSAPAPREKGKKSEGDDMLRSMRRARANLRRLALANSFDYFVTLTLDQKEVDRYDPKEIMRKVNRWLDNMVRRHGLRYVIVPEQHKDGAWHFHGFFAGDGLEVVDSGIRWNEREVYNLPQWKLGFTSAQRLYGEYSAAVAYVCKYIGKQQGERPMGRWYYSGGNLSKPEKVYATLEYRELLEDYSSECVELEIPGTKMLVIHHKATEGC